MSPYEAIWKFPFQALLVVAVLGVGLAGCGGSGSISAYTDSTLCSRFVNAATGSSKLDPYLTSKGINNNSDYGENYYTSFSQECVSYPGYTLGRVFSDVRQEFQSAGETPSDPNPGEATTGGHYTDSTPCNDVIGDGNDGLTVDQSVNASDAYLRSKGVDPNAVAGSDHYSWSQRLGDACYNDYRDTLAQAWAWVQQGGQ